MKSIAVIAAGTAALAALAAGCNVMARRDDCVPARRTAALRCCAPWTVASGGSCGGRRWHLPAPDDGLGDNPSQLDLAVTTDGKAVITWIEASKPSSSRLVVATETKDGSWRFDSPAEFLPGRSLTPKIACASGGACGLVWAQVGDGGTLIYLASYRDGVWTPPRDRSEALSFAPHSYDPQLAVGDDGEILVVWNQHYRDLIGAAVARLDPDGALSRPREGSDVLSPPLFFVNDVRVARNRRGDALVSWFQSTGGPLSVFVSERHGSHDNFSRPVPDDRVSPAITGPEGAGGRFVDEPVVAIAESGAAALVWEQPVTPNRVAVFAAMRDAAGKWTTPSSLDQAFSSLPGAAWRPEALFTERGDLYIAWIQADAGAAVVMLAHRLLNGSWLAPGRSPLELSTGKGRSESLELASSSEGATIAVWSESIKGIRRVFARRRSADIERTEAAGWEAQVELSASMPAEAYTPKVATGGPHGRVVAAWIQASRVRMSAIE